MAATLSSWFPMKLVSPSARLAMIEPSQRFAPTDDAASRPAANSPIAAGTAWIENIVQGSDGPPEVTRTWQIAQPARPPRSGGGVGEQPAENDANGGRNRREGD